MRPTTSHGRRVRTGLNGASGWRERAWRGTLEGQWRCPDPAASSNVLVREGTALFTDPWTSELFLPARATSAGRARHFVTAQLHGRGLTVDIDEIELVTSELVTNAIRHAQTPFTVTVHGELSEIRVRVRDANPVMGSPAPEFLMGLGGRGLRIAEALSDAWGVDHELSGKSVWALFHTASIPASV